MSGFRRRGESCTPSADRQHNEAGCRHAVSRWTNSQALRYGSPRDAPRPDARGFVATPRTCTSHRSCGLGDRIGRLHARRSRPALPSWIAFGCLSPALQHRRRLPSARPLRWPDQHLSAASCHLRSVGHIKSCVQRWRDKRRWDLLDRARVRSDLAHMHPTVWFGVWPRQRLSHR